MSQARHDGAYILAGRDERAWIVKRPSKVDWLTPHDEILQEVSALTLEVLDETVISGPVRSVI